MPLLWLAACTAEPAARLHISNPLTLARPGAVVTVLRSELAAAGLELPAGQYPILMGMQGEQIATQWDDLDGDGRWDELVLQTDLGADEEVSLAVGQVAATALPTFVARTGVYLGVSRARNEQYERSSDETLDPTHEPQSQPPLYQMEGPAWENDMVGFRSYFDRRNGKDIFGKRVPDVVLDTVVGRGGSYHSPGDWGMDILKVGNSLGAGALALMVGDSLVRLGQVAETRYRVVATGPLRSIMELSYTGWTVAGASLSLRERIEVRAGEPGYRSTVSIQGLDGPGELVTGIVNLHSDTVFEVAATRNWRGIATHALQSENQDHLGMAVLVPSAFYTRAGMAPEAAPEAPAGVDLAVTQTYWIAQQVHSDAPARFFFMAAWEGGDKRWGDRQTFLDAVEQQAAALEAEPVWKLVK
ncbi:MAG: hypothetical protein OHK0039_44970 [Bacteroidia bacterium]